MISYYAHNLYANYSRKDVIIYVKTRDGADFSCIKLLSHTYSLLKVKLNADGLSAIENLDDRNKWNYIVLARGFMDDESRTNYVSTLLQFKFVEEMKAINIEAYAFQFHYAINIFIKTWGYIGSLVRLIPTTPLLKATSPVFNCVPEPSNGNVTFIINLQRIRDRDVFSNYVKVIFTQIFPAINSEVYYGGVPVSEYWTSFIIAKYENYDRVCEMLESEIFSVCVKDREKGAEYSYEHICY